MWQWRHVKYAFECNQFDSWDKLGGRRIYHSHLSKSTKLDTLTYRVPHRFIFYTLNVENDSNGQVLVQDLKLMFASQYRIQVDTTRWLIHNMYSIKNNKHVIRFGMLISLFTEKLGLNLVRKDPNHLLKFKEFDYFTV